MTSCLVELRCSLDHETLFSKTTIGGDNENKVYFQVQPNASFEVLVTIDFAKGSQFERYDRLLLRLSLDGEDVGFSKRCTSPFIHQHRHHRNHKDHHHNRRCTNTVVFDGYRKQMESGGYKVLPFKFSETILTDMRKVDEKTKSSPVKDVGSSSIINNTSLDQRGSLVVTIFEAYEDRRPPRCLTSKPRGSGSSSSSGNNHNMNFKGFRGQEAIDKDKKFWTQPSVTVTCDDVNTTVRQGMGAPPNRWCQYSDKPLFTWMGYYHTSNIIKILQLVSVDDTKGSSSSHITSTGSSSTLLNPEADREMGHDGHYDENDDDVVVDVTPKRSPVKRCVIELDTDSNHLLEPTQFLTSSNSTYSESTRCLEHDLKRPKRSSFSNSIIVVDLTKD